MFLFPRTSYETFLYSLFKKLLIPNVKTQGILGRRRVGASFSILLSWVIILVQNKTGVSCKWEFTSFAAYVHCHVKEMLGPRFSCTSHTYKKKMKVFFSCVGFKWC